VPKETKNKSSGSEADYSSLHRTEKVHPKHRVLFSASAGTFLFFIITVILLFPSIFAFGQNISTGNIQTAQQTIPILRLTPPIIIIRSSE
jgi:hypothetical protein